MRALLLIDIQNDFLPGGALAVPDGDAVIPVANMLQDRFELVIATQDWHPADHKSFAANHPGKAPSDMIELAGLPQVLWPVHCVQGTFGAELSSKLKTLRIRKVFRKGEDPEIDSYSGFFDNGHRRSTGLAEHLQEVGVSKVFIVGIATDYCVKFTALDALRVGLQAAVIEDACRGVNLQPDDVAKALAELTLAGVAVVQSHEVSSDRQ